MAVRGESTDVPLPPVAVSSTDSRTSSRQDCQLDFCYKRFFSLFRIRMIGFPDLTTQTKSKHHLNMSNTPLSSFYLRIRIWKDEYESLFCQCCGAIKKILLRLQKIWLFTLSANQKYTVYSNVLTVQEVNIFYIVIYYIQWVKTSDQEACRKLHVESQDRNKFIF